MAQKQSLTKIRDLGFNTLNDTTHLYKPSSPAHPSSTGPGLVIVCSWAFARDKHISKYLKWYQQRYPASRILLLQGSIHNMIWRPDAWQGPFFEPAVLAIKDYLSSVESEKPKILLHIFSNGGAHSAVQLAQFYARSSASTLRSPVLPIDALVLDSTPGFPNGELAVKALVQGLPKASLASMIGPPIVHATVALSGLFHYIGVSELAVAKVWRTLNDMKGPFLKDTIPRTYIFSDVDEVIEEKDVKRHAEEAIKALEAAGSTHAAQNIRCEEFIGTAHVNHMLKNSDRYWNIVKDTWKVAVV